jgi:hypothetical protein
MLALRLVTPIDRLGRAVIAAVGVLTIGHGLWRLRVAATCPADAVVHPTLATAPRDVRERSLRWKIGLGAVVFPVAAFGAAKNLLLIERGNSVAADLITPVAWVYALFGFWPALLFVPAVGALTLWSLVRSLQKARDAAP